MDTVIPLHREGRKAQAWKRLEQDHSARAEQDSKQDSRHSYPEAWSWNTWVRGATELTVSLGRQSLYLTDRQHKSTWKELVADTA